MAQRRPPFDFDLNEPPPPEDDDAPAAAPVTTGPYPAPQHDPAPEPEPSPQRDPLPAAQVAAEPSPHGQTLSPAPTHVAEASTEDPLPAPVPDQPSPYDSLHPPSPVLDLEAPLSSLDDEDECGCEDEAEMPLPPPPPLPLPPPPLSCVVSPCSQGTRTPPLAAPAPHGDADAARHSSHEASAARGPSRDRATSDSRSFPGSRRWSSSFDYDSRDDAISKQRRVDYERSRSRSGSGGRRSDPGSSPRRYERSVPASPRPYEQDGRRHVPAMHAPPRNRRRRRRQPRPQHGNQYQVPVLQRPQQALHGPGHGPGVPEVGYSSYNPMSGLFVRWNSSGARLSPKQEPIDGNGGYRRHHHQQQRRKAPPFRPSSRPHGGEDPYHGRQIQAQEPLEIGGYHHSEEAPSFRPAAQGREASSGGRQRPAQQPINNGGAYGQRKEPRGREDFPGRQYYHPYAHDDGGAADRVGGGNQGSRRDEPPRRPDYEHRRTSGGPAARGRQYYGDVQK